MHIPLKFALSKLDNNPGKSGANSCEGNGAMRKRLGVLGQKLPTSLLHIGTN